jgi:hypothetical protein
LWAWMVEITIGTTIGGKKEVRKRAENVEEMEKVL